MCPDPFHCIRKITYNHGNVPLIRSLYAKNRIQSWKYAPDPIIVCEKSYTSRIHITDLLSKGLFQKSEYQPYYALTLMISFGALIIALLTLVVAIVIALNHKK